MNHNKEPLRTVELYYRALAVSSKIHYMNNASNYNDYHHNQNINFKTNFKEQINNINY